MGGYLDFRAQGSILKVVSGSFTLMGIYFLTEVASFLIYEI